MSLEANAVVICNSTNCREKVEISLTETITGAGNSWDDRDVEDELAGLGWSVLGDDHYCPDHSDADSSGDGNEEDSEDDEDEE